MKVINKYNEMLEEFASEEHKEFEMAVIADMMLDSFRYKNKPIIDAINIASDYKTSIKKG
jgi:hypothetical protein